MSKGWGCVSTSKYRCDSSAKDGYIYTHPLPNHSERHYFRCLPHMGENRKDFCKLFDGVNIDPLGLIAPDGVSFFCEDNISFFPPDFD